MPKGWLPFIECGAGWDRILDDVEERLNYLDPNYEVNQVKEKFGTLRFYYETAENAVVQDIMDDVISMAEFWSARTCEICGVSSNRGDATTKLDFTVSNKSRGGWYRTLCNTCAEKSGYAITKDEDD